MPSEITENPLQKPINPHIHAINDSYTDPKPWARMKSVMKSYPVKHSLAVVSVIAHLTENWSGLVSVNFDFNLIVLTSYLKNTVIPHWVVWGGIWEGWVKFKYFKEFDSHCTKSNTPRPISFQTSLQKNVAEKEKVRQRWKENNYWLAAGRIGRCSSCISWQPSFHFSKWHDIITSVLLSDAKCTSADFK